MGSRIIFRAAQLSLDRELLSQLIRTPSGKQEVNDFFYKVYDCSLLSTVIIFVAMIIYIIYMFLDNLKCETTTAKRYKDYDKNETTTYERKLSNYDVFIKIFGHNASLWYILFPIDSVKIDRTKDS